MKALQKNVFLCVKKEFCRNYARKTSTKLDPTYVDKIPVYNYPIAKPSDRRIYAWGLAETGALGVYRRETNLENKKRNKIQECHYPMRLTFGELYDVTHVASGYGFSAFAVKSDDHHKLFGTGLNSDSQIGHHDLRGGHPLETLLLPAPIRLPVKNPKATKVIGLSAGRAHLLVLTDNEGAFTLGNNAYGQCGRRVNENEDYHKQVTFTSISKIKGEKIINIECGQDHSIFITETGKVYVCGWGADGQLGNESYNSSHVLNQVKGDIVGEKIVKVSSYGDCILALNDKGEVFGWGNNEYGQLGSPSIVNQQVHHAINLKICNKLGKIVDIAAGGVHCLILNEAGDVFSWGFGILGMGPQTQQSDIPLSIPKTLFGNNVFNRNSRVMKIFAGLYHSAAITNSGDLYMWGKNKHGCLGIGHAKDQFFPFRTSVAAKVLQVSCGTDHTLALCKPFI